MGDKEVGMKTIEDTRLKKKPKSEKNPMKIPQGIPSVVGVKLAALEGMFESLVTSREGTRRQFSPFYPGGRRFTRNCCRHGAC